MPTVYSLLRWIGYLPLARLLLLIEAGLLAALMLGGLSTPAWLKYVGRSMYYGTLVGGPVLAASLLTTERRPLVLSRPLSRFAFVSSLLLAGSLGWMLVAFLLLALVALWHILTGTALSLSHVGVALGMHTLSALALLPWTLLFWLIWQDTLSAILSTFILNFLQSSIITRQLPPLLERLLDYLTPPLNTLAYLASNWPTPVPGELVVQWLSATLLALLLITWTLRNLES